MKGRSASPARRQAAGEKKRKNPKMQSPIRSVKRLISRFSIFRRFILVFLPLLGSFFSTCFVRFLGAEGTAIMTTPKFLLLLFVLLLSLTVSYRILLANKKQNFFLLFFILMLLFFFFSFAKLFAFLGITTGALYTFYVSNSSLSTGNEDSFSSTTISIESSDSRLSHSHFGAQNPEPGNNILSHFGNQNPDLEIELYARIRLLESRLIDQLPPQLNFGEYESLARDNLNQSINIQHYHSALSNELFDITVLELKANLQDQLFHLLLSEPDERLILILRESPFNERAIRTEALAFIEEKIEAINLANPRYQHEKILIEHTLRYWLNHLQEHGPRSLMYTGFVSHFRGEG